MILDTNALSAWAEGFAAVEGSLRTARRLIVPSIVLGEYYFGIRQSRHRRRYEDWLRRYLPLTEIATVTHATARVYADVRLELKQAPVVRFRQTMHGSPRSHDSMDFRCSATTPISTLSMASNALRSEVRSEPRGTVVSVPAKPSGQPRSTTRTPHIAFRHRVGDARVRHWRPNSLGSVSAMSGT